MIIPFTKCHGLGNDYLFIDLFRNPPLPEDILENLAVQMCRRHTGAGADGIVLFRPHATAAARMHIFNADGSEAENCGNALRCVAKLLYDREYVLHSVFEVVTGAGPVSLEVHTPRRTAVASVSADMGTPSFRSPDFPFEDPAEKAFIEVRGVRYRIHCVSVGNPHCVLFFERLPPEKTVMEVGAAIERHRLFPRRINVEFCSVKHPGQIEMRVWERGSGLTLACGTGAAAAFATARRLRLVSGNAVVAMPGGLLTLSEMPAGRLIMRGPAEEVYSGTWVYRDSNRA